MSEYKDFVSALKQRNTKSMKNLKRESSSQKNESDSQLQSQKDQVAKLEFLKSKKARKGLPSKIRAKMFKDVKNSVKQSK